MFAISTRRECLARMVAHGPTPRYAAKETEVPDFCNNSLYNGELVWNRRSYIKDPRTGNRVARPNVPDKVGAAFNT